jgi:hypothetical protein
MHASLLPCKILKCQTWWYKIKTIQRGKPTTIQSQSNIYSNIYIQQSRSQWPRGLRHRSAAARGFESHRGAWMFVCCECSVLWGRGLCDGLITRPEESYRLLYVVVCDLETSRMKRPWPALGGSATKKKIYIYIQQDATLNSLFISGNCSTCFGWYLHPSSEAHTTVSTACGICQSVTATCRYSGCMRFW